MALVKIDKNITKLFDEYLVLAEDARAATSALGRKGTEVKNAIKTDMAKNNAPFGSFYTYEGMRISFETSVQEGINAADLFQQYEEGHITKEQFLKCIKVNLGDVKTELGGDVVEALKQPIAGKEVDLRVKKLEVEEASQPNYFHVLQKETIKRRNIKRNDVLSSEAANKAKAVGKRRLRINR